MKSKFRRNHLRPSRKSPKLKLPVMEVLEDRRLLAAGNTFAQFSGTVDDAAEAVQIPITISAEDFALRGNSSLLGFHLTSDAFSSLDPATVEIRDGADGLVPLQVDRPDLPGSTASLALANLSPGNYTLHLSGEDATAGAFQLDVFLAGDANGDRSVDRADADLIRNIFGAQSGDENYLVEADADLNGRIGSFDLFQWHRNSSDATSVEPLTLTAEFKVGAATLSSGDSVTDDDAIEVSGTTLPGTVVEIDTDGDGQVDETAAADSLGDFSFTANFPGEGPQSLRLSVSDAFGQIRSIEQDVNVVAAFNITSVSPANGEELVNVTRETIVRFSKPIDPATVTDESIYLAANGERVAGRLAVSSTNRFATFFYDNPLPASTEVRIVIDGDLILGANGKALDANNTGEAGGRRTTTFRTLSLFGIEGTNVFGFVKDSFSEEPIAGVTVRLEALPGIFGVTDATGRFELQNVPAPDFFVVIDGSTAAAPEGTTYPSLGKAFHSIPGRSVQLFVGSQENTFNIYLPALPMSDIQELSATEMTEVGFGDSSKATLAEMFPDLPASTWDLLKVGVAPGGVTNDFGVPADQAFVVPVPPDRIPAPLPAGIETSLVVSLQTGINGAFNAAGGATNFDVPAPVTFPNFGNLAPGEKNLIFWFNHDAGRWDVIGTGTVSEDGSVFVSDPGVGIPAPGWGFTPTIQPTSPAEPVPKKPKDPRLDVLVPRIVTVGDRGTTVGEMNDSITVEIEIPLPLDEDGNEISTSRVKVKEVVIEVRAVNDDNEVINGEFSFQNATITGFSTESNGLSFTQDDTQAGRRMSFGRQTLTIEGIEAPDVAQFELLNFDVAVTYEIKTDDNKRFEKKQSEETLTTALVADRALPNPSSFAALAEKYKPTLFFEQGEQFFPTSVESTLATAYRFTDEDGEPLDLPSGRPATEVGTGDISTSIVADMSDAKSAIDLIPADDSSSNDPWEIVALRLAGNPDPTVYYAVANDETNNRLALTYWFHFGYSNWKATDQGFNNHESDWESITIFFSNSGSNQMSPTHVGYAQHVQKGEFLRTLNDDFAGGELVEWDYVLAVNGNSQNQESPSVYVGRGGHASYPDSDVTSWIDLGLPNDEYHIGSGERFGNSDYVLSPIGSADEASNSWKLFPGLWGQNDLPGGDTFSFEANNGPKGPLFTSDSRWYDPWEWMSNLRTELHVTPVGTSGEFSEEGMPIQFFPQGQPATTEWLLYVPSADDLAGAIPLLVGVDNEGLLTSFPFKDATIDLVDTESNTVLRTSDFNGDDVADLGFVSAGIYHLVVRNVGVPGSAEAELIDFTIFVDVGNGELDERDSNSVLFSTKSLVPPAPDSEQVVAQQSMGDSGVPAALIVVEIPNLSLQGDSNNLGGVPTGEQQTQTFTLTNTSANAINVTNVAVDTNSDFALSASLAPFTLAGGETVDIELAFAPSGIGLKRGFLAVETDDSDNPVLELTVVGTGIPEDGGTAANIGKDFIALITPENPIQQVNRLQSNDFGQFSAILTPNQFVQYQVFDPETGLIGSRSTFSRNSGQTTQLVQPIFQASTADDTDGDGLPDDIEFTLGTRLDERDSDGDGLDDFVELEQGLNPLDGITSPTGLIANVELQGQARKIVLEGSPTDPIAQTAYIATGTHGLAIVDASQFQIPIVLGQLDLPGTNVDIAVDPQRAIAAVASLSGLHLVDIADPLAPVLLQTVPLTGAVRGVEVFEGLAYVTRWNEVVSIDLQTGEILDQLELFDINESAAAIARQGSQLVVISANQKAAIVDISEFIMTKLGEVSLPASGDDVFVGNDIAYIAARSRGFGYVTVDISDPRNPSVISGPTLPPGANVGPGNAIVSNGSGLGLLVGSSGGLPVLDVVGTTNPAVTNALLGRFNLPAIPESVTIGGGIAFLAGGASGLQVINYRDFDTLGVAPTVTIETDALDADPVAAGVQVVEGSNIRIMPTLADDVQVRFVELLVDGIVVQNDLSHPYDFSVVAPNLSSGVTSIDVQVRATDTGGNSTISDAITLRIIADVVPPTLSHVSPGSVALTGLQSISLTFDESLDTSLIDISSIEVVDFANPGTPLTATSVVFRHSDRTVQFRFDSPFPEAEYELRIKQADFHDRVGNPFGTTTETRDFKVVEATAFWTNPDGGFWDDVNNWQDGVLPGVDDGVSIVLNPGAQVVHRSGTTRVARLTVDGGFVMQGGTLNAGLFRAKDSEITISGGTLQNTIIQDLSDAASPIIVTGSTTFRALSVDLPILVQNSQSLTVQNGLTLNDDLTLAATIHNTTLSFTGTQTLDGTGSIVFGGTPATAASNDIRIVNPDAVLTTGPDIEIVGGKGNLSASSTGGLFNILGTVQTGVDGDIVLNNVGNVGGTLALDATEGQLTLAGTPIVNTTINSTGQILLGSSLTVVDTTINGTTLALVSSATLDNVVLNAPLEIANSQSLTVQNGLTLNDDLTLAATIHNTTLSFTGTQTLDGTGSIVFGGTPATAASNDIRIVNPDAVLTTGPDIEIVGGKGNLSASSTGSLFNILGTVQTGVDGDVVFNGDFVAVPTNRVVIEIGGAASGEYGTLAVTGNAALAGALEVSFTNGFTPIVGQQFQIINFGSTSGDFDSIDTPAGTTLTSVSNALTLSVVSSNSLATFVDSQNLDGLDYLIWAASFGDDLASSPENGDYNDDGRVDGLDYLVWARNFGAGVPAVPAATVSRQSSPQSEDQLRAVDTALEDDYDTGATAANSLTRRAWRSSWAFDAVLNELSAKRRNYKRARAAI